MSEPQHGKDDTEKEYEKERDEAADPLTEAVRPEHDEDIDEEKGIAAAAAERSDDTDEVESLREQEREITLLKRLASGSVASVAEADEEDDAGKKKRSLNPLRWGKIPPIPEERIVCPEVDAGFFSKLIFHWQASMMRVRSLPPLFHQGLSSG